MDYIAMLIGYTMMVTGAVLILGYAVYFAADVGNKAHWKLVNHLGGYKVLMQFKKWRDEQAASKRQGGE